MYLGKVRFTVIFLLFTAMRISIGYAQEKRTDALLPTWAIKSNLLYNATATVNLGAEVQLTERYTLDVPVSYNPWTFNNNRKWKHILIQPEVRYWFCEAFNGHFVGVHGHYAFYNVGGVRLTDFMSQHRFEGWLAGAGISYGYQWILSNRWSIEGTIGVGYAFLSYNMYTCETCGPWLGSRTRHYVGPTKAGVSIIYIIK